MKLIENVSDLYGDLISKKEDYVNNRITKYVARYEIIDSDHIKVISNIGKYRMIRNTEDNLKKLNRVIIKNKINAENKIDEYESNEKMRMIRLLVNILMICISGVLTLITFTMGSYLLILFSLITFSLCIIATSISAVNVYLGIREIQNMKDMTGYKLKRVNGVLDNN